MTKKPTYLHDYRPTEYLIDETHLRFDLAETNTRVTSRLKVKKNPLAPTSSKDWRLDGHNLKLLSLKINDEVLSTNKYQVDSEGLTIFDLPETFELGITTAINPQGNTRLEGLYRSSSIFCTQCEAEGFRSITYYADRPDLLAKFTTTIVADESRYPWLLSNGDLVSKKRLDNGLTEVVWHDPFPKPCYLFALVAGDLKRIVDSFTTRSGKQVSLQIFTEPRNADKLHFAMDSLKRAMRWDEEKFGREYDLDTFMIVAVEDFNMGAMENKGLNIFNTSCLLTDQEITTDAGFKRVESVVAHEYFHNWSGNRVTCRDWFQLSLKEGLTVFRDSEFSADLGSRVVKRIEDVRFLRNHQFNEDKSPMAHPVQPDSYVEISNFYTLTIYEKGAELVRMISCLLGQDGFRKGCDLYFDRHDGQAVTIEEFICAMEDANNGYDLSQFRFWYKQAGTPQLKIKDFWNQETGEYRMTVKQFTPPTPDQNDKKPLHIPLAIGLLDQQGNELLGSYREKSKVIAAGVAFENSNQEGTLIAHLKQSSEELYFTGLVAQPIPSLNRRFSAPVVLDFKQEPKTLAFLMANDMDGFSRWDASQALGAKVLLRLYADIEAGRTPVLNEPGEHLLESYKKILTNLNKSDIDKEQKSVASEILTLPSEQYLATLIQPVSVMAIHKARQFLKASICQSLSKQLQQIYQLNNIQDAYKPDTTGIARRSLKNICLDYLLFSDTGEFISTCVAQYKDADNMTDRLASLQGLLNCPHTSMVTDVQNQCLADFKSRFSNQPLAMNIWFSVQASSAQTGALERVKRLAEDPAFDMLNPNKVRSLFGAWAQNQVGFHESGSLGYSYFTDQILILNKCNPQIAARLIAPLGDWPKHTLDRQKQMQAQLSRILATANLSPDVYEIAYKSLNNVQQ